MVLQNQDLILAPHAQALLQQLLLVWLDFERRLGHVPLLRRLGQGTFTEEDYRTLLFNLRPQVVEGARWITRAASSFTSEHVELRSTIIGHALDEHRDYAMLESDYVAMGGVLEEIRHAPRNVGTEALSAFLMHQASLPNPIDLLGAMFIIESLGTKMAGQWAHRIQEILGIGPEATRFLGYHGENDATHIAKLHAILNTDGVTEESAPRIVKTAKVVARLYVLQLEELDNV